MERHHAVHVFKGEQLTLKQAYHAAHLPMTFVVDAAVLNACGVSRNEFLTDLAQGSRYMVSTLGSVRSKVIHLQARRKTI